MIKLSVIGLALFLSACNAHALRQILVPAPEPEFATNDGRLQFDCTENGLVIFEGFPDIVRAHPLMVSNEGAVGNSSTAQQHNADRSRFAPCKADLVF